MRAFLPAFCPRSAERIVSRFLRSTLTLFLPSLSNCYSYVGPAGLKPNVYGLIEAIILYAEIARPFIYAYEFPSTSVIIESKQFTSFSQYNTY